MRRAGSNLQALSILLLAGLGYATRGSSETPPARLSRGIRLEVIAKGLRDPLYLTAPAGDPRLFVVEQPGRIRIIENGALVPRPFLDLSQDVGYGGERGLLSMAFHPRYRENGLFFANFTDRQGNTRVVRFRVSSDPNLADPASRRDWLEVDQPYANHNGGDIRFGLDGMLYVGMGDGGARAIPRVTGRIEPLCSVTCCGSTWIMASPTPSPPTTHSG